MILVRKMADKFKVGNRVKYTSGKYGDDDGNTYSNPLWGGKQGKVIGTVKTLYNAAFNVHVKWDTGKTNTYKDSDLELAPDPFITEIESLFDDIIGRVDRWESQK